jgi:hypothetical protein
LSVFYYQVALALYASSQVLLLGVRMQDRIVINPGPELVFHEGDYSIYVMALAYVSPHTHWRRDLVVWQCLAGKLFREKH